MLTNQQTHDITTLIKSGALDVAYEWLLEQRKNHSHNNSIWHLRFNWTVLKPILQERLLKLKMHPDKTYLGCIKKGFDFLGIHFGETPEISESSKGNHQTRIARRYAQNESEVFIGRYRARWTAWCNGLLKCCMEFSTHRSGRYSVLTQCREGLLRGNNHETVLHNDKTSFGG